MRTTPDATPPDSRAPRPAMLAYLAAMSAGYHGLLLAGLLIQAGPAGPRAALGLASLLMPIAGAGGLWCGRAWGWWLFSGYYASQAGLTLLQLAAGTPHPRTAWAMALAGIGAGRLVAHALALALTFGTLVYLHDRSVLRFVGLAALPRRRALGALLLLGALLALAMYGLGVWA